MAQISRVPRQLSSRRVLLRFAIRLLVLLAFAAFGSIGFGRSLAALLWMAIIFCIVVGVMKREALLGSTLNHWDEGVAYGALFALVTAVDHLAAA